MSTKKLTQDVFIGRCREIHGNKFNYENSKYINSSTKIEVKCNTCSHLWHVSPGNHIGPRKSGCPNCKKRAHQLRMTLEILSTDEFIYRSMIQHGNKFDYSVTEYKGSNTKIQINCPTHGKFEQWPQDHMNGRGCERCGGSFKKTTEEFIEEAIRIFPQFDYSLVKYSNAHIPVEIICPDHGLFLQKPNAILNHVGCNKCSVSRQQATKILRGIVTDPKDKTEYENYRRAVWRISNQQYKLHKEKINPENLPRSPKYHLDHKYSIQQGWVNGKSANEVGDWTNLQILEGKLNRQKGSKLIYQLGSAIYLNGISISKASSIS